MKTNDIHEVVFEAMVAQAIRQEHEAELQEIPSEQMLSQSLTFSRAFQLRIKGLAKKSGHNTVSAAWKRMAVIAACLLVLLSGLIVSSEEARAAIKRMFLETFEKYTAVYFVSDKIRAAGIEFIYVPTGYSLLEEKCYPEGTRICAFSNADGVTIHISAIPLQPGMQGGVDNENTTMEIISIAGNEGYIAQNSYEAQTNTAIGWSDGTYVYGIFSSEDADVLLRIAEGMSVISDERND